MNESSRKKSKSIILLGASFITLGCVLAGTSLAWFCPPQTSASLSGITGEATGSYFEDGNGTSAKPYIIATPKQLYYFNWLQDLGYFNKKQKDSSGSETSSYEQVYFKVVPKDGSSALDMADYTLPPAGTETHPFIGNFDGNGVAINNLTISNAEIDLTDVPKQASISDGLLEGAKIVGFFGIVGQYETSISYDTSINAIDDLYFDNLTVESGASKTLAGFIAGYANGKIDNCGIHCGQFSFANGATALTGTKLEGKSLSRFTLIGDYDETSKNFVWKGQPTSGGDEGNDWGGSVDFRSLNRRLNYMYTMGSFSSSGGLNYSLSAAYNSNLSLGYYSTNEYYWLWNGADSGTSSTIYIYDNTIIPLNIDKKEMGIEVNDASNEKTMSVTNGSSTVTYHTNAEYQSEDHLANGEKILSTNTGYIVGAGANGNSNNSKFRAGIRPLIGGTYKGIYKSLGYATNPSLPQSIIYDKTRMELFTIDADGNKFKIKDDVNKDFQSSNTEMSNYTEARYDSTALNLQKYKTVRAGFDEMMEGSTTLHGFHFMKCLSSASYETIESKASIGGIAYDKYTFVKGGLNFTVKETGYITAILAGCFGNGNHTAFDLFKVDRDASTHQVNGITQIDKVYTDASGNVEYDPADTSGKTLKYEFKKYTQTTYIPQGSAFYVEIPVSAGDYIIGTASDSNSQNAYLLYLDIGANGSGSSSSSTTIESTNIDFVYKENGALAKITDEGYTPSGVVFSIGGPSTSAGLIYFKRETKNNKDEGEVVYVGVAYYAATGCSITPAGNGKSTKKEPDAD